MRKHPVDQRTVTREQVVDEVSAQLRRGRRLALVAGHDDETNFRVVYVFLGDAGDRAEVSLEVPHDDAWVPSLAGVSYQAGRFERELHDMFGIVAHDHPQPYRLVRHAHWPTGYYPLRSDAVPPNAFDADAGFPFMEVAGKGVYEIPVGPVHAGLIEPGHFRFSVVGETIVRMYQRLYFVHRGVEKLFIGRSVTDGVELAERVSGDTAVGHSLAYLMAVEDALDIEVGQRALVIRALLLECERLYNHVNDLGALANDAGFGIANAHAGRLREKLLRHNAGLTGHRLLRGALSLGGAELLAEVDVELIASVAADVAELAAIATGHSLVANRFNTTAVLPTDQAERLGVLGYVARASGVSIDARRDQPFIELGSPFAVVTRDGGDVRARFDVRVDEVAVSARLVADLAGRLAGEPSAAPVTPPTAGVSAAGLGVVEAWRGTVVHRVELDPAGLVRRLKIVDPSFLTWPALPVALNDVIVPDFPLANKSFNCSYAGNDL
ncbi:MAG TPA: NADH-quinone oxidoreductase subunit C [Propionicimonas sp.]|nr:NADH-quinone oxidoreductase subunit C [Propionicimonas sp.]